MAREITSSWICSVPSKRSIISFIKRIAADQRGQEWSLHLTGPTSICDQFEIGTRFMCPIVVAADVPRRQAKID
jgi:hypothetical protein